MATLQRMRSPVGSFLDGPFFKGTRAGLNREITAQPRDAFILRSLCGGVVCAAPRDDQ